MDRYCQALALRDEGIPFRQRSFTYGREAGGGTALGAGLSSTLCPAVLRLPGTPLPHPVGLTSLDLAWPSIFKATPLPRLQYHLLPSGLESRYHHDPGLPQSTGAHCAPTPPTALPTTQPSQTFWKRRESHLSQLLNISSHLSSRCRATSTGMELSL